MTLTESSRKGDGFAQFRQMYLWELKRNRVLSAVYAALTLLCFTVVFICQAFSQRGNYLGPRAELAEGLQPEELVSSFSDVLLFQFNADASMVLVPLSMLFVAVYCVTTFGYMHNRRSVDLFHALPVRRTPMLLAGMAAGATVLLAVTTVSTLLCGIAAAAMGAQAPFTFPLLLGKLGYFLLTLAAALALTTTLLVCSGTAVNAVISGLLIMVGWPMLCLCACAIIQDTLPGCILSPSMTVLTLFVPWLAGLTPFAGSGVNLILNLFYAYGISDPAGAAEGADPLSVVTPGMVIWWVLFTAVLTAAAVFIYRRRGSEEAENHFSFPPLRMVIQFLIACAVGMAAGLVFGAIYNNNVIFFLAVLVFSAAAHAVTQIIWVRGVQRFKGSLPTYGAALAVMALFFLVLASGGLGYVSRVPAADSVESIRLNLPGYHYDNSASTYLGEHCGNLYLGAEKKVSEKVNGRVESTSTEYFYTDVQPLLTSPESVQAVEDLHQTIIGEQKKPYLPCHEEEYGICELTYRLKNGGTLARQYQLPDGYGEDQEEEESGADTSEEPREKARTASPEVLKKMAAVVALDEYQACSLTRHLPVTGMSVTCALVSKKDPNSAEIADAYGKREGLTARQMEKIWATFLQEVDSDRFTYDEGDADPFDSAGGYSEDYYNIQMDSQLRGRRWSKELRELLERCSITPWPENAKVEEMYCNMDNSGYVVPPCCTRTRALIRACTKGARTHQEFDEEDGMYIDPNLAEDDNVDEEAFGEDAQVPVPAKRVEKNAALTTPVPDTVQPKTPDN